MERLDNSSSASMVSGTSSDDSITNIGSYATIDAGEGKDTIVNSYDQLIALREVDGVVHYDSYILQGSYSSLSGGEGNDVIIDLVGHSTINPGKGNDSVTIGAYSVLEYAEGDGNVVVSHYDETNVVLIDGLAKNTAIVGKDVVTTVGSGKITLKNAAGLTLNIIDDHYEFKEPVEIYDKRIVGTEGDDILYAQNPNVTVKGLDGNDVIDNNTNVGTDAMLMGGAGNDTFKSNSRGITIDGGEGDDQIRLNGFEQTVWYRAGDGDDTIYGYQPTDIIHLVDGSSYSTQAADNDVVIKVGKGTITLKDVTTDTTLNIDDSVYEYALDDPEWEIAEPSSKYIDFNKKKGILTVNKNFRGEIDAANFDYNGITKIDASNVQSNVLLKAGKISAALIAGKAESTLVGGNGNDKLYGSPSSDVFVYAVGQGQDQIGNPKDAGSLYQEQDAIAIVGSGIANINDVSIKDTKTAAIITFGSDKKSKLTINKASIDTPLTLYFGPSSDTALEMGGLIYGELPEGVKYDGKGYTRLVVDDTLDATVIDAAQINSQIVTINASNAEGAVDLYGNANNNVLKASKGGSYIAGGAGNDQLYGSPDEYNTFEFQMQNITKKDVIHDYKEGDQIVIDMSLLEDGFPEFDESTGVITYEGAKSNFNGFNDSKSDVVITLNKRNTLTIKNASGKAIELIDADGEYLGTFGHVLPEGLTYNLKKTDISVEDPELAGYNEMLDINLSNEDEYENLYFTTVVNVDLTGAETDAILVGNKKNNELKAGEYHSEINGGAGNDKLYASTAEDASADFYYNSGKDTLYNFDPEVDYIYIDADTPIDYEVLEKVSAKNFVEKGNDVILNINAKNSITIKDGVGKIIEIFDENGALDDGEGMVVYNFSLPEGLAYDSAKRTSIGISDSDTLIEIGSVDIDMSNEGDSEYTFATSVKKVDLSSIDDENFEARIVGNDQANELYAPNGGSSELYGGHSDKPKEDKLVGGNGEDVFVYAPFDGKDQIIGYTVDDLILLDDTFDDIESIAFTDRKNEVSVTLNGDKNSVFTIKKDSINTPITFQALVNEINGAEYWDNQLEDGFVYGPDEHMSLNADGSKLQVVTETEEYIYVNAREVNSQIKLIDARQLSADVYVELIGNGNSNTLYASDGGSFLDGGYDALRMKATNDTLIGGAGDDEFVYSFELGLGGKDLVKDFDSENDILVLDTAPKSVTANGRDLVFNFDDKIDGKRYTGSLTVKGVEAITSDTEVCMDVEGELAVYKFGSKLKNAAWDSEGITVGSGIDTGDNIIWLDDTIEGPVYHTTTAAYEFAPEIDKYWFDSSQSFDDDDDLSLDTIIDKETAVDLPTDFMSDVLKSSAVNELGSVARHRSKKQQYH